MRLSTAVALVLAALLTVLAVGTVVAVPAATDDAPGSPSASSSLQPTIETAEYDPEPADPWQVIHLEVSDDGDVRWTIESRFVISANETTQFEAFADAVADGDREIGYDVDQYEQFRDTAERSTDRGMSIENATWNDPRIEPLEEHDDRNLGVVSYSVTWTNFAVADGQRVHFGDAFLTTDGAVWFPILEDGQRFVVESPSNYGVETAPSVPGGIQDGTIVHNGPATLEPDDFDIVFLRGDDNGDNGGNGDNGDNGNAGGNGTDPTNGDGSVPYLSAAQAGVAFAGFVVVMVVASLVISRYQRSAWPFDDAATDDRSADSVADGSASDVGDAGSDPDGVERVFDERGTGRTAETNDETVDVDLLSDEERVRQLLERNGGRMKQASIVAETGWSDAKVSQLLSQMDDDDEIEKLRIGRENLITLPDVEPAEVE